MIRELQAAIVEEGVGHNYLIQHTTGSGKSNSIAWLAHLLTHLYRSPTDTHRIFDSIIVVTDRRVLDKQLQDTIRQVEQVEGVVHAVEKTSAQLRQFLESGKDIIISTIQKFSVIAEEIGKLKSKTFAVIVDEAHSSQSGESARNLRISLSQGIALDVTEDDPDAVSDIDARILEQMEQRRMQEHISYFAFSGTPKNKTLELFGRKDDEGKFVPFHVYPIYGYISQLITFTDVALEKLYIFGRTLNKKLPKREHPDLQDVSESVDLDSVRIQKTHDSLQLRLEAPDSEVEGIGSDVATLRDPEQDFPSNIIDTLNDAHQTDFTMEDKVDIENVYQKVRQHEELRQVIEADNSESNKRYKFDEVIDEILLDFVKGNQKVFAFNS